MFIIASIKPMEHCLVPFLNECDANDDHTIDLVEWGTCLGIGDGKYFVCFSFKIKQKFKQTYLVEWEACLGIGDGILFAFLKIK